jgi:hypothetical protein
MNDHGVAASKSAGEILEAVVVLVTLLNYGQVIGSKKKTSLSKVTDRG